MLQSLLHVLKLTLKATLHLREKHIFASEGLERSDSSAALPRPCCVASDSAQFWRGSAGSAAPGLWSETLSL